MKKNRNIIAKAIIVIALLVFGLSAGSCTSSAYSNYGWSGATVDGETIYVASAGNLAALQKVSGAVKWEKEIKDTTSSGGASCGMSSSSSAIYANPVVDNGTVYVATYSGKIYAYDTANGNLLWEYPSEGYVQGIIGGLIINNGVMYFGVVGGVVTALDIATQQVIWQYDTTDKLWASPCLDGDTLYVASYDKNLYALDVVTGEEKWAEPFETKGPIVTTPVCNDGTVYIGSLDRGIYAIDAETGDLKWSFSADSDAASTPKNWFWATPVISDGVIYAPNMDGFVYILDAESGALVTALDLEVPVASSPVLLDGKIIVATESGNVYSISTANNTKVLLKDLGLTVHSSLAVDGGMIYAHTMKTESLYAINGESGVVAWYYEID
jgi:eukaryotic-like serine/threonine-protein kinase